MLKTVLSPQIFLIYKKFEAISVVGGHDLPLTGDIANRLSHKMYKFFWFFIVFSYTSLNIYGIYDNRSEPVAMLLQIGSLGAMLTGISITYDFICYCSHYKEILLWIAEFQMKHRNQFGYFYEKAFVRARRTIKAIIYLLGASQVFMLGFSCLVQIFLVPVWTEDGKFNIDLPRPVHIPWIPVNGWIGFCVNFVYQHFAQAHIFVAYALFMGVNSVILEFIQVHLKIIGELVKRVSDNIRSANDESGMDIQTMKVQKDLTEVLEMHVEVSNFMNKLVQITSRTYYSFKINSFVFTFYIYFAIRADESNQIQALGGIGGLFLSFLIAYSSNAFQNNVRFILYTNDGHKGLKTVLNIEKRFLSPSNGHQCFTQ